MTQKTRLSTNRGHYLSIITASIMGIMGGVAFIVIFPAWGVSTAIFVGVGSFGSELIMYWSDVPSAYHEIFVVGIKENLRKSNMLHKLQWMYVASIFGAIYGLTFAAFSITQSVELFIMLTGVSSLVGASIPLIIGTAIAGIVILVCSALAGFTMAMLMYKMLGGAVKRNFSKVGERFLQVYSVGNDEAGEPIRWAQLSSYQKFMHVLKCIPRTLLTIGLIGLAVFVAIATMAARLDAVVKCMRFTIGAISTVGATALFVTAWIGSVLINVFSLPVEIYFIIKHALGAENKILGTHQAKTHKEGYTPKTWLGTVGQWLAIGITILLLVGHTSGEGAVAAYGSLATEVNSWMTRFFALIGRFVNLASFAMVSTIIMESLEHTDFSWTPKNLLLQPLCQGGDALYNVFVPTPINNSDDSSSTKSSSDLADLRTSPSH